MPRLTPCPSCHAHVMVGDRHCPHCGAGLSTVNASRAGAVLIGLALAGCPGDDSSNTSIGEPEYGVPDTGAVTVTGTEGTTGGTGGSTSGTTGGTTDGSTTDATTDSAGEAEYGVPETGSTSIEPDYGVPDTSG